MRQNGRGNYPHYEIISETFISGIMTVPGIKVFFYSPFLKTIVGKRDGGEK